MTHVKRKVDPYQFIKKGNVETSWISIPLIFTQQSRDFKIQKEATNQELTWHKFKTHALKSATIGGEKIQLKLWSWGHKE